MRLIAFVFWIVCGMVVLVAVLEAGAFCFMSRKKDEGTLRTVDLVSAVDERKEKEKEKPPEEHKEKPEHMETETEQPPDSTELMRNLDVVPPDNPPALEAASLSAIEAALSGQGAGGDFSQALSFASGGTIGGTGVAGGKGEKIEEAFSLSEIDQKPRAVFQESPLYPAEMRGKKVEGVVTVEFVVDATGKVDRARVEKSSLAVFETPALNAVRKWKFEPGVRAGQRVPSKLRIQIRFPAE
jgi:protein TonB